MRKSSVFKAACLLIIIVVAAGLFSCARKSLVKVKAPKKGRVGEEYIVQKSSRTPRWVDNPDFDVIKEKGKKFIVVKADIYGYPNKRAAERIAEGELRKKVAEGIRTLVQSQFQEALAGTQQSFTQSFESYVVTVADNIPVVGLVVTDTYWEKIQRIKSKNEVEYVYRVLRRARMPYQNYIEARDNAWEQVLQRQENEAERQKLEKIVNNMK